MIDFSYSFATPHRLTVARPDSRDKTLLDLSPGKLRMAWTYEDLSSFPVFSFLTPTTRWEVVLTAAIDDQPLADSSWMRVEGCLPALVNSHKGAYGAVRFEIAGGATAAIARVTLSNTSTQPHRFTLTCEKPGNWAGMNPGWVDADAVANVLEAGWLDRADRVLVLSLGADAYPARSATTINAVWDIPAGETRTGWFIRPYAAYAENIAELSTTDWSAAYDAALAEWRALLARAITLHIPDPGVRNGFLACLADLFIMREPLADGHIVGTPGTEMYRAPNSYEAGISAVALDQVGLHADAARGYELPLMLQEANGDWTEPKGWAHLMWGGSGFKSWVVMQHYALTRDHSYLEEAYPRMRASSHWQETMRAKTRNAVDPLVRGLMPRGMGDCGLKDGDDLYGVFIPHNIWAVYADKLTLQAARLLGKVDDVPELERIYQRGLDDLLRVMDLGAIQEDGYRWIPGVPGKTSGSRWGVLNALAPCGLLPPDHELINGTLRHIEAHLSPGGIPINTGWLADGMWVAITLDNIAAAHLARGNGDAAAAYLYAVLNHGTPLYTWCEERGQEPYTEKITGDRQHLWTPVAVVRALRDCMVLEQDDGLHLALGAPREWVASGEPVGIDDAPTHYGHVSCRLSYDAAQKKLTGSVSVQADFLDRAIYIHVRLPDNARAVSAANGLVIADAGQALLWQHPRGQIDINVICE